MSSIETLPERAGLDMNIAETALSFVRAAENEGVYASADMLFKGAVFGRDSLKVGSDLLYVKPELTHEILLTMAKFQGVSNNPLNEEEAGKIFHEKRLDKDLDATSKLIFEDLTSPEGKNWGKEWSEDDGCWRMVYFGSVDATPSFVRLLCEYTEAYGESILYESVRRRDGSEVTLMQSLEEASDWVTQKLQNSPFGLIDYRRQNPTGIENQVWKDSREFYVHPDGSTVNHDGAVASIEVQGITYTALTQAAKLLPKRAEQLMSAAENLRNQTIELLWQPENHYFAVGVDQDIYGNTRIVHSEAANPGCLLDSSFFDGLPEEDRRMYVTAIVEKLFSPDFLTDAGIRSRSLAEGDRVPFWDYHGSYVTWPKETQDIIRGLHMQGMPRLAQQLENRLLNAVHASDAFPEFFYVGEDGAALVNEPSDDPEAIEIAGSNSPERTQAWTVSAVLAVLADKIHGPVEDVPTNPWQKRLEAHVLQQIPNIEFVRETEELKNQYPNRAYRLIKSTKFIEFPTAA